MKRLCSGVVLALTSLLLFLPATPAMAASLSVLPTHAPVDALVNVNGSAFTPGANYQIRFAYNTSFEAVTSGTVDPAGNVSRNVRVPEMPGGAYNVRVSTSYENATVTFDVDPEVQLSISTAMVNDQVTIQGTGFRASRSVTIRLDNRSVATALSNSRGSFTTTFRVPEADRGSHEVSADDGMFEAIDSLLVTQSISISPTSGSTGTEVTITGRGFRANRSMSIFFDDDRITTSPTSVRSNSNGSFTADFDVPICINRTLEVMASDGTYTASTSFTVVASITLSQTSGEVGSEVTIIGHGFRSNRNIEITFDEDQLTTRPSVVRSDETGCFEATFLIPPSTKGIHKVEASDGIETDDTNFTTEPTLILNPSSGPINSNVSITGTGFSKSRTVTVRFDGDHVRTSATDSQGNFADQFVVPSVKSGNYAVTADDGTTSDSTTFTVTTSMEISPVNGNVGSYITVQGTGFTGVVTIKYDDSTLSTTRADANGNFSISFKAPASRHGQHTISASDAVNALETLFIMESDPPPAPHLVSPENESKNSTRPTFNWDKVSDPSGVTYTLQIATDDSFSTILLEKWGLSQPPYTLTKDESLRGTDSNAPYYWRVRAVDGAENESDWSALRSFYVRYLPQWALILIISAASVAIAISITRRYYKKS
ncbi:MAG: IPT/TIG domain-containing protein [Dehalococcoidales bacterium]|nr:IPT/TIG domain-containing protein [Dehalococcoidales bacterium]